MGTIGNGLYGQVQEAVNTTGSAIEIQHNLANFAELERIVRWKSALTVWLNLAEALDFDLAIFTNLPRSP